ncbi:CPSF A subunit region-domain-containing protein [Amylostereum chailletii]|nr:CPSF A subunit region-domain-containing protein [Amylostereum chailletii]
MARGCASNRFQTRLDYDDTLPFLIPVPALSFEGSEFEGGVLIVGGTKILFFELASQEWQAKKAKKKERPGKSRTKRTDDAKQKGKDERKDTKRRKPKASVDWPWHEVSGWCHADEEGYKYMLGDSYGRLALLSLTALPTRGPILIPLGEVSSVSTLAYIASQVVFVGSHYGDHQLVRILTNAVASKAMPKLLIPSEVPTVTPSSLMDNKGKGKETIPTKPGAGSVLNPEGSYIEVLETWPNIAPIVDAALADTDGSGHSHVITASGGRHTGSLRVIRTGADINELALVEGTGSFTHMFPLRARYEDKVDKYILATDGHTSQLLHLTQANTVQRIESAQGGFVTNEPTLVARNIANRVINQARKTSYQNSPWIVQVTPRRILVVEHDDVLDTNTQLANWLPPNESEIVAAALNPSQLVIALSRGALMFLRFNEQGGIVEEGTNLERQRWDEVSAVSVDALNVNAANAFATYFAVGFWCSNRVQLYQFNPNNGTLELAGKHVTLPALPRSIFLHNFGRGLIGREGSHPYLLVGLTDGSLVSYAIVEGDDKMPLLTDRRVFSLGNAPVTITRCVVRNKDAIFATGSRAVVISWASGSLQHSPVPVKGVTASTLITTEGWKSCVALSTSTGLVIGSVRDVEKMQIRTIPMGLNTPRRVVHDPELHMIAVASLKTTPGRVGEPETSSSAFTVLDDNTFDVVGDFQCEMEEEVTALETFRPRGADSRSYFCVGTMIARPDEREPSEGRLLVFRPSPGGVGPLQLLAETQTKGCVYTLTSIQGFIIAAVNTAVVVYDFESGDGGSLKKMWTWNHNYLVTTLAVHGTRLFVGDAIHSIAVLDMMVESEMDGDITPKLQNVARDYSPLWPVALGGWDEQTVVAADADMNLHSFTVQTVEGKTKLERDGSIFFDDIVNKFIPGSLQSADTPTGLDVRAKQAFFTATGRIGVLVDMGQALSLHMSNLQRNLGNALSTRETDYAKWRTPTGRRRRSDGDSLSYGFLDGDLLEKVLSIPQESPEFKRIKKGNSDAEQLTQSYSDIRQTLETLRSLHG